MSLDFIRFPSEFLCRGVLWRSLKATDPTFVDIVHANLTLVIILVYIVYLNEAVISEEMWY